MSDTRLAWLNEHVWMSLIEEMPRVWDVNVQTLTANAGFEMDIVEGRLGLRATTSTTPLVYVTPLQKDSGAFRDDVLSLLSEGVLEQPIDIEESFDVNIKELLARNELDVSVHNRLQLQLYLTDDPLSVLAGPVKEGCRFFRIGSTSRLHARLRVLEIIAELSAGLTVPELSLGANYRLDSLVSGVWNSQPASLVCFPLTARLQPLALIYMTRTGSQIVTLPPTDNVFNRIEQMVAWPAGNVGASIKGSGHGVYKNADRIWDGNHAATLLKRCTEGANGLLEKMSDPAQWRKNTDEFDEDERWLAWTSLSQALDALTALAEFWRRPSSIWDAFRALSILEGVWAGTKPQSIGLHDLLHPKHLHDCAQLISDDKLRGWSLTVADNWAIQLKQGFPGKTVDESVMIVSDLRNLLHGVGAAKNSRTRRLNALRHVSVHQSSLHIISDIAVIWWSIVLFRPDLAYRPGFTPWSSA